MQSLGLIVASLILSGCAVKVPAPPDDGFVRAEGVGGCCSHVEPRLFGVRLGTALETSLRDQLNGRALEMPQCWYEDKENHLILESGNACMGSYETHFHFSKVDGTWRLARVAEFEDVALCHVRKK